MRSFTALVGRARLKVNRSLGRVHRIPGTKVFVPNGTIATLVVLTLIVLAIGLIRQNSNLDRRNKRPAVTSGEYEVVRVIDGDTFVVIYDGEPTRVRIMGIDAPESGQRGAAEATDALYKLVDGKSVKLSFAAPSRRDGFGRLLANVEVDGIDIGTKLLNDRFVLPYRRP